MDSVSITIIGAGVIGCAIARELSRYNISVLVLDSGSDIAEGATKANSGIIHAGFDAKPGSNKAYYNIKGAGMYKALCETLGVSYKQCGALVIALSEAERFSIEELYQRGIDNGVKGVSTIERDEILRLEPNINPDAVCALNVPSSAVVSPYEIAFALADDAAANGVRFIFDQQVKSVTKVDNGFIISTDDADYSCGILINCSGAAGAEIHNLISDEKLSMVHRRGQYYLLDRMESIPFSRTIFQCPSKMGKGVLVSPTVHGNLILGPTAEDVDDPANTETTREGLADVVDKAKCIWPSISVRNNITNFSGIRAHLDTDDFVVGEVRDVQGAYEAIGIESPGLSSAPAIAKDICEMIVRKYGYELKDNIVSYKRRFKAFRDMNDEERFETVNRDPLYGRIICRCEMVTEAEIREAIRRPVGARTIDAVKRRTRAGMGRCQGGFCSPRVVDIIAEELGLSPLEITKNGGNSNMLMGTIDQFLHEDSNHE